jgi:hypothetical protein
MNPPIPPKRVTEWKMRWLFQRHHFLAKVSNGELVPSITRDTHPSRTVANEPFCTRTQEISYLDGNRQEVARVHQYLRTNGTIGASGRPDPKRLKIGTQLYRMHTAGTKISPLQRIEAWALKYLLRMLHMFE